MSTTKSLIQQSFVVSPQLSHLNHLAEAAKKVAFTQVDPIFSQQFSGSMSEAEAERRRLLAFRLSVEGPERQVNYFTRMLNEANLINPSIDSYF